jgi:hypothetical protein
MLQTHLRSGFRLCNKLFPIHPVVGSHLAAATAAAGLIPPRAVQTASMAGAAPQPAAAERRKVRGVVFDMDGKSDAA